jgi:tetratricopeptide (TPR) repeat protein
VSARARALAAVLALAAASGARSASPEETLAAANVAYQAGRYDEAAAGYRELIAAGARDVRVEYNLGCAAFKLGRIGESVLHYERARRLDARDPEIADSLAVVRERVLDRVETPEPAGLVRAVRSAQDALGPTGQFVLVIVCVWLFAAAIAWGALSARGFPALLGWGVAALAAAAGIAALSWWFTWQRLGGTPAAVVLEPSLEVLSGPGGDNPSLFTLHEGTVLEVRSAREGWMQVSLPNGLNGWVPRDAVAPI